MRKFVLALLVMGSFGFSHAATAQQCVPYARQISGIGLQGDAWRWWAAAEGSYSRGSQPQQGAVLVFKQTRQMRHGHVAVISKVVGRREVLIDHANWGNGRARGKVERNVAAIDVSPNNDWTQVRVWHAPSGTYGARINPAYGFIYQQGGKTPRIAQTAAAAPAAVTLAAAKPVPVPAAKPARSADDLNRLVLAKLTGK